MKTNNFVKNFLFILLCPSLLLLQSCASIFNSGSQSIVATASGDVENVSIEVVTSDGAYKSRLPTTIVTTPSSFNPTSITVKDKCYEETKIEVKKTITPAFWGNILLGGLIGGSVDYFDGYMWKMDRQVSVPLNKREVCKK